MEKYDYHIKIFYSEEDECYIAVAPELKGCSAFGDTLQEAALEMQTAMEVWLEAAKRSNIPIPKPNLVSELSEYSGKFNLRIPRSLHRDLAKKADDEGVSLNQLSAYLLARGLDRPIHVNIPKDYPGTGAVFVPASDGESWEIRPIVTHDKDGKISNPCSHTSNRDRELIMDEG